MSGEDRASLSLRFTYSLWVFFLGPIRSQDLNRSLFTLTLHFPVCLLFFTSCHHPQRNLPHNSYPSMSPFHLRGITLPLVELFLFYLCHSDTRGFICKTRELMFGSVHRLKSDQAFLFSNVTSGLQLVVKPLCIHSWRNLLTMIHQPIILWTSVHVVREKNSVIIHFAKSQENLQTPHRKAQSSHLCSVRPMC